MTVDRQAPSNRNVLVVRLLFPLEYGLFLTFSLLDLFFTLVIVRIGGLEVNPLADFFLRHTGKPGFIAFKLVTVFLVIGLCEFIGRRRRLAARLLLWFAIALLLAVLVLEGMQFMQAY